MIEEGCLSKDVVIAACLDYMSEIDVQVMMEDNEFVEDEEDMFFREATR
jgi:hypothetical protein